MSYCVKAVQKFCITFVKVSDLPTLSTARSRVYGFLPNTMHRLPTTSWYSPAGFTHARQSINTYLYPFSTGPTNTTNLNKGIY